MSLPPFHAHAILRLFTPFKIYALTVCLRWTSQYILWCKDLRSSAQLSSDLLLKFLPSLMLRLWTSMSSLQLSNMFHCWCCALRSSLEVSNVLPSLPTLSDLLWNFLTSRMLLVLLYQTFLNIMDGMLQDPPFFFRIKFEYEWSWLQWCPCYCRSCQALASVPDQARSCEGR